MLIPNSTDHSFVICSLLKVKGSLGGKELWKSSSSLTKNQNYITGKKILNFCTKIESFLSINQDENSKIEKFCVQYTKDIAK